MLLSPCLSLWCPFEKRHRSSSACVAYNRVQMRIQSPLDTKTAKTLILQTLCQKDGKALQRFLDFDTRVNIVGRCTVECVFGCLPRSAGCLFT